MQRWNGTKQALLSINRDSRSILKEGELTSPYKPADLS
jgi:hypothetical protein